MLHSAPVAPIRGVFLSYSLRCLRRSSPWHRVHPQTIQSGGLRRASFLPGCSNPGGLFVVLSLPPRKLQSVAPGSPPDDPVRGPAPCFIPPRLLQSRGSFCRILSAASDAPVRGTRFTPGRSSPGASAVFHSSPVAPIRGVFFVIFSPLPRTLQSVAPGSPPDDPVRGLAPCFIPPRLPQSGGSFCRTLSAASDARVRGARFTPGRTSLGANVVLHSAPVALIRGVFLSYSPRCLGRSSPWHWVHSPDDPVRGLEPCSHSPRTLESGASCFFLSLLTSLFVCAVLWCPGFFFRAPFVVAPLPLSPLCFAFPAPSPPSPPPVLPSPAPFLSLCGGFAGARTQAPSVYARMLLCFGAGTLVHSSSPFPACFLFSCIVPPFVPSLVACTLCCLCLPLVLSSFVCFGHAHKLLLLRMQFATILVFHSHLRFALLPHAIYVCHHV